MNPRRRRIQAINQRLGARGRAQGRARGRGAANSPAAFRAPLTPRRAGTIARKEAGLEFNPVINQMKGQVRGSVKRSQDLGQWYQRLAQDYQRGQQAAQGAFDQTQQALDRRLQEAAQRNQGTLSELSASDQQFAKLVGGPTNAAGLSQAAQAAAAAERERIAQTTAQAQQAANYLANSSAKPGIARLAGIQARGEERRHRGKIQEDLGRARRERGAATVRNLQDLRKQEIDTSIQRRAFPLKRRELNQQATQDAIAARQAQERIGISRRNAATSERNAGKGGLTPSQRRSIREGRRNAISAGRSGIASDGWPKTAKDWARFEQWLAAQDGVEPAEARWAVDRLKRHRRQTAPPPPQGPQGPVGG